MVRAEGWDVFHYPARQRKDPGTSAYTDLGRAPWPEKPHRQPIGSETVPVCGLHAFGRRAA